MLAAYVSIAMLFIEGADVGDGTDHVITSVVDNGSSMQKSSSRKAEEVGKASYNSAYYAALGVFSGTPAHTARTAGGRLVLVGFSIFCAENCAFSEPSLILKTTSKTGAGQTQAKLTERAWFSVGLFFISSFTASTAATLINAQQTNTVIRTLADIPDTGVLCMLQTMEARCEKRLF